MPTAPSAVQVRVGLYFGTVISIRGSIGNMNGRPGKNPVKAFHHWVPVTVLYNSSRPERPLYSTT